MEPDLALSDGVQGGWAATQGGGAAAETLASADVVSTSILDALDLLLNPKRLTATL